MQNQGSTPPSFSSQRFPLYSESQKPFPSFLQPEAWSFLGFSFLPVMPCGEFSGKRKKKRIGIPQLFFTTGALFLILLFKGMNFLLSFCSSVVSWLQLASGRTQKNRRKRKKISISPTLLGAFCHNPLAKKMLSPQYQLLMPATTVFLFGPLMGRSQELNDKKQNTHHHLICCSSLPSPVCLLFNFKSILSSFQL